jgi:hypothetical protein
MSIEFLTEEELEDLTGHKWPSKQKKVLDQHGIFYIERPSDGKLRVTPQHVYNPTASPTSDSNPEKADFSSLGG